MTTNIFSEDTDKHFDVEDYIHVHKYDQKIIDEQVRIALEHQKGDYDVKRF